MRPLFSSGVSDDGELPRKWVVEGEGKGAAVVVVAVMVVVAVLVAMSMEVALFDEERVDWAGMSEDDDFERKNEVEADEVMAGMVINADAEAEERSDDADKAEGDGDEDNDVDA